MPDKRRPLWTSFIFLLHNPHGSTFASAIELYLDNPMPRMRSLTKSGLWTGEMAQWVEVPKSKVPVAHMVKGDNKFPQAPALWYTCASSPNK